VLVGTRFLKTFWAFCSFNTFPVASLFVSRIYPKHTNVGHHGGCCESHRLRSHFHVSNILFAQEFAETLLALFDHSPEEFAWRYPVCDQVEARRSQMNNQLIFDVLLTTGGIQRPDTLYPPSDVDSLKLLLNAIRDSTYDTLKKDCLIYYLIKWHKDGREEVYRDEKCIPPQFVLLADAYWYLDTGVDVAVRLR
jgi:hypothetical protein